MLWGIKNKTNSLSPWHHSFFCINPIGLWVSWGQDLCLTHFCNLPNTSQCTQQIVSNEGIHREINYSLGTTVNRHQPEVSQSLGKVRLVGDMSYCFTLWVKVKIPPGQVSAQTCHLLLTKSATPAKEQRSQVWSWFLGCTVPLTWSEAKSAWGSCPRQTPRLWRTQAAAWWWTSSAWAETLCPGWRGQTLSLLADLTGKTERRKSTSALILSSFNWI